MQKLASTFVGAALLGLIAWMTWEAESARIVHAPKQAASAAASTAEPPHATPAESTDAGVLLATDAGLALSLGALDAGVLPSGAPKSVKLGLVFVTYAGAEGAATSARNKRDARALAEKLALDAKSDFHKAVTAGDPGSSDDLGRIPRGVLDSSTEVAVFSLVPGTVSDVLETPKGYWIVKRLD